MFRTRDRCFMDKNENGLAYVFINTVAMYISIFYRLFTKIASTFVKEPYFIVKPFVGANILYFKSSELFQCMR